MCLKLLEFVNLLRKWYYTNPSMLRNALSFHPGSLVNSHITNLFLEITHTFSLIAKFFNLLSCTSKYYTFVTSLLYAFILYIPLTSMIASQHHYQININSLFYKIVLSRYSSELFEHCIIDKVKTCREVLWFVARHKYTNMVNQMEHKNLWVWLTNYEKLKKFQEKYRLMKKLCGGPAKRRYK